MSSQTLDRCPWCGCSLREEEREVANQTRQQMTDSVSRWRTSDQYLQALDTLGAPQEVARYLGLDVPSHPAAENVEPPAQTDPNQFATHASLAVSRETA